MRIFGFGAASEPLPDRVCTFTVKSAQAQNVADTITRQGIRMGAGTSDDGRSIWLQVVSTGTRHGHKGSAAFLTIEQATWVRDHLTALIENSCPCCRPERS